MRVAAATQVVLGPYSVQSGAARGKGGRKPGAPFAGKWGAGSAGVSGGRDGGRSRSAGLARAVPGAATEERGAPVPGTERGLFPIRARSAVMCGGVPRERGPGARPGTGGVPGVAAVGPRGFKAGSRGQEPASPRTLSPPEARGPEPPSRGKQRRQQLLSSHSHPLSRGSLRSLCERLVITYIKIFPLFPLCPQHLPPHSSTPKYYRVIQKKKKKESVCVCAGGSICCKYRYSLRP